MHSYSSEIWAWHKKHWNYILTARVKPWSGIDKLKNEDIRKDLDAFRLGEKKIWNIKQNRRNVYKGCINLACHYKRLNITPVEEEIQSDVIKHRRPDVKDKSVNFSQAVIQSVCLSVISFDIYDCSVKTVNDYLVRCLITDLSSWSPHPPPVGSPSRLSTECEGFYSEIRRQNQREKWRSVT